VIFESFSYGLPIFQLFEKATGGIGMRRLREWIFRFGGLFNKRRKDHELDEEIESHLQMHIEDNLRLGMTPEEARRQAMIQFGGIETTKEAYRDQRSLPVLETLWQDIRYGKRMLRKNPGFTTVAVLTLGLGIGATTAIFSLADAFLFRMLPVKDPQGLFFLSPAGGRGVAKTFNYDTFQYLGNQAQSSAELFAYRAIRFRAGAGAQRELVDGQLVSGNYFSGLGVSAVRGRVLASPDDLPGAEGVAVISHRYWQRRFGNDTAVLGKLIELNGVPCTIIGIMPPGFIGLDATIAPDVFAAIQMQPRFEPSNAELLTSFGLWPFTLMARLKPEASPEQAAAEFTVLFQRILGERGRESLREADIKDIPNRKVVMIPGSRGLSKLSQQLSKPLFILMGVTGSVLLIACSNIANLLLSRGTARHKEIAVRLATGATRMRLIRQLLVESGLLAAAGTVLGILLALWSKHSLLGFLPSGTADLAQRFELNYRMIGFTGAVFVVAAILSGVLPALRMTRIDLATALKDTARNLSSPGLRLRLNNTLVITQVSVSLLVLIASGLFVRTMWKLSRINLGFNANNLTLLTIKPAISGYSEKELGALVGKLVNPELIARLEKLPGVQSASLSSSKPIADLPWWSFSLKPLNGSFDENPIEKVYLNSVTPEYFLTLGVSLQRGRAFTATDRWGAPIVAVVNETLVKRHFGGQDPLNRRFAIPGTPFKEVEIVGVVEDSRVRDVRSDAPSLLYMPFAQFPSTEEMKFAVRMKENAAASVVTQIRSELEGTDQNLVVDRVETARALVDSTLLQERSLATLTSIFGVLGLLLAAIGLYGIMAYSVSLRTAELGIRMALGADQWMVLRMVMRQGLQLVIAGILTGLTGAFVLTRMIASQLFGISPVDPTTFVSVSLALLFVAVLALWLPAWRAAKVDPMVALRFE